MKYLTTILFLLGCLAAFSQDVISETKSIDIQRDTTAEDTLAFYYLKSTLVIDNGTDFPDTSITSTYLGDSTAAANYFFREGVEGQQQMSAWLGRSLLRQQSLADFNANSDLYEEVTGDILQSAVGEEYQNVYLGEYRVLDQDSSFFAEMVITPSNLYRLRRLDGPNGSWDGVNQWVVRPYSRLDFLLVNFEGKNWHFVRDTREGARNLFWPIDRIVGSSGAFRILKIE